MNERTGIEHRVRQLVEERQRANKQSGIRLGIMTSWLLVFVLIAGVSPAFAQLSIIDASDSTVVIRWLAPGDDGTNGSATTYEMSYDNSPITASSFDFAFAVDQSLQPAPSGTEQTYEIYGLDTSVTNYITIRAIDDAGNLSVLTNNVTATTAPTGGAIDIDENVQGFTVTVPADAPPSANYLIQMDPDPDFGNPSSINGLVSGSEVTAYFGSLTATTLYYWRYRIESADSTSSSFYSIPWEVDLMTSLATGQPAPPTLLSPADNDSVSTTTPNLTVLNGLDLEGDPLTYQFQLFDQSGKTLLISDSTISEGSDSTSWNVPANVLDLNMSYQWQARCFDGFQYSPWTLRRSFTIQLLSANTENEKAIPDPYPSPVHFASGEMMTFLLPSSPVTLRILDPAGDLVYFSNGLNGTWLWNGLNGDGAVVVPGVYLWYLSDDYGQGKFVVLP